jgi:hypothetical protein
MKRTAAYRINQIRGASGSLWQEESYDQIIRDEEHLWKIVQYVGRNPKLANIPKDQWIRWIDASWTSAGWRFVDE